MRLLTAPNLSPWRDFDRMIGASAGPPAWTPDFDIAETDSAFIVRADLPGVTQKDLEIRVDQGVLSVKGGRQAESAGDDAPRFSRRERPVGTFARRFRIPDSVDADGVKAAYANGVLELTLPKQPEEAARLIPVN